MKRALTALAFFLAALPASPQALTQGERERAMSELHATRKLFLDAVDGLSEAQWNFKPTPDRWSVAEAAEHIAVSEDMIFSLVTQKIMQSPAEPDKREKVKGRDETILQMLVDRSHKAQAPEQLRPTHRWPTRQELVDHFKESRDKTIAYVDHTQDALRDHFFDHPAFGTMDGYQWILLISGHSNRHVLQINEVKADPNFPK